MDKVVDFQGPPAAMSTTKAVVSQEQAAELVRICKGSADKLYSFLTAVVCSLIHQYNNNKRFCISSPIYRQNSDQEFINKLLPIPMLFQEGTTFKQAIIKANHAISASIQHQNYPIGPFLERYAKDLQTGGPEIYEVVTALRSIHDLDYIRDFEPACVFDFDDAGSGLILNLHTSTARYKPATVRQIIRDFDQLLTACLLDIKQEIAAVPIRSYKLKTCIIGRSSIAIRCVELIREEGHQLALIITNDKELKDYAVTNSIDAIGFRSTQDIVDALSGFRFDYLFSINNPKILSAAVLGLPERGTINYHDALLPSYAGMYATTWAIANGESRHGITWHAVVQGIDTGDILAQQEVEILPDETVFSLNLKCYNAAVEAFSRLLSELEQGTPQGHKQDLQQRSYFPLHKRPFAAGILDFTQSAETLEAQVRSVDFKDYENPMTVSKLQIGGKLCHPMWVSIAQELSTAAPGTVTDTEADRLTVATRTHDLVLHSIKPFFEVNLPDFAVLPGRSLLLPADRMKRLDEINKKLTPYETYWVRILDKMTSPQLPMLDALLSRHTAAEKVELFWLNHTETTRDALWEDQVTGAFLLFLKRASGDESFGVQYADDDIDKLIEGETQIFSRFVPVFLDISGGQDCRSFIAQSLESLSRARSNLSFPRDVLLRYGKLKSRYGAGSPMSSVKISCTSNFNPENAITNGELLHLVINQERKLVTLWYNAAAIEVQGIGRFISAFRHFHQNTLSEAKKPVMEVPMVGETEKNVLLHEYNKTDAAFDDNITLCRLFEKAAIQHEERIALVCQAEKMTYRGLNEKANQLAASLVEADIESGEPVSILARRSFEMVVAMIAVLKAGGTYIPLDLNQPSERIAGVVRQVAIRKHIIYKVDPLDLSVILDVKSQTNMIFDLDKSAPDLEFPNCRHVKYQAVFEQPPITFTSRSAPEDIAYVIHTSGSTGEPKGVVVKHRPVINILEWVNKTYQVSPEDRLLFVTSIGFDLSVYDVFGILGAGASLYIATEDEVKEPEKLCSLIADAGISIWDSTPGTLQEMSQYFGQLKDKKTGLRLVMLSGDWISLALPPALWQCFGDLQILGMGGATEATIWSNYFDVTALDPKWASIPYGKPIQNCRYYIADEHFNVCPVGVEGDLYIGGICVAEGYLNKPELTAHRFLQNPWLSEERIYRTGDRARWLEDGNMEFLGRLDDQVKIRGFRIELGEIEHQLLGHHAISEVRVAVKTLRNEKALAAYFISDKPLTQGELRDFLQSKLPEYMIPAYSVRLDKMPLTSNGKVDKKRLPDPVVVKDDDFEPAETALEHSLVAIWSEVLKLDPSVIGVNKSFFEMGGHSLRATVLINKILESTGVVVPLREVFEHQDIRSQASLIASTEKSVDAGIPKAPVLPHYPLSSPQKRLYFLYEMQRESLVYNMPRMVRLEGVLDPDKIEEAFSRLIARHEILRTSFVMQGDEPRQYIEEEVPFTLGHFSCGPDELEATFGAFVQPFDLAEAPLIRAAIVSNTEAKDDYVLMVDQHHIVTDGISQGILINEFMAMFEGDKLEAPSLQYKDFAWWQYGLTEDVSFKASEVFWKTEFADGVPVLDLPTDFTRPAFKQNRGGIYSFSLDTELFKAVKRLSERTGTTLYSVILALFNVVLARLGNRTDLVIGTPVGGRQHAQLEKIPGMFVNMLPVRNYPEGAKSFIDFLHEVQAKNLHCFDHQSYPYEDLVESLQIARNTGRNPLFDVSFSYQNFERASLALAGMSVEEMSGQHRIAKFDLTLEATETATALNLNFEFSTELFTQQTIKRYAGYFVKAAQQISEKPEVLIRNIDMLGGEERSLLIEKFNNKTKPSTKVKVEKNLVQLFRNQVASNPERIALSFNNQELSYAELDDLTNEVAWELQQKSINQGDSIAVLVDRSIELIVAILGVLKSGCAYLPVDTQNPVARIRQILTEGKAKLLLTAQEYQQQYEDLLPVFVPGTGQANTVGSLQFDYPADSTAYVIFTSGTTGKPKGVPISHSSVIHLIESLHEVFNVDEHEHVLLFSNIAFDASVEQIWLAFMNGARLVVSASDNIESPARFNEYLIKNKITHLHTSPSYLATVELQEPNYLKRIAVGGEACSRELVSRYAGSYNFYNEYGPTETTVSAMVGKLSPDMDVPVTIGKPLNHSEAYVLGKEMELLPLGVAGELFIGGCSVSKGYVNNEEQTKERFLKNPFGSGNMYKTGDLVRWTSDGNLLYLGRIDEQLQIRGFRVEPEEVANQLQSHPEIKDTAVISWEEQGELVLVAFYTSTKELETDQLREFLLQRLPGYMVPAYFRKTDGLPTTPNGKLDRMALREHQTRSRQQELQMVEEGDVIAPQSELEETLVSIWSEVLKLEPRQISLNKSFFEMGGHSLRAIVMINKLQQTLGVTLPLRDVFIYQDIKSIAGAISGRKKTRGEAIAKAPDLENYPLSSPQKRLYFLYALDKSSLVYNMPRIIRLKGALDKNKIEGAFRQLIERHEILRTRFVVAADEPRQQVHNEISFELECFKGNADQLEDIFSAFVRPFDLEVDLPIRAGIVSNSEAENDYVLMVDQHHIATDGVSQSILINEFMSLYKEKPLEEPSLQYKDFACWQHGLADDPLFTKGAGFWKSEFGDEIPQLNLPTDFERPVFKRSDGGNYSFSLAPKTYQSLRALAENTGTTLYTVTLAIFNIFLAKLGNQEDIVVGTPVAGRQHGQLDSVVGMFVNTLPVRNFPEFGKSFKSFLQEVQERNLKCFEHQSYPYEELVESLLLSRDTSRNPLFDVLLSYQNFERPDLEISGLTMHSVASPGRISKFDLTLQVQEAETELHLNFEYATALFKRTTIERFAGYLRNVVEAILMNPETEIQNIDMPGPEERQLLIRAFNNKEETGEAIKTSQNLIQRFKKVVDLVPDEIALVFNNEKINYVNLDKYSDKIATQLKNKGVGIGDHIGILIDRSAALITAILGVLKTGATYLPIDVQNPIKRTAQILEEAEVKLLITTADREKEYEDLVALFVPGNEESKAELHSSGLPEPDYSDESIAYVIFTSGTTGKPKGVPVPHANVTNVIDGLQELYKVDAGENILLFSNIAFDASVEQLWLALLHGATLVILSDEHIESPSAFNEYLIRNEVTHFHSTPSFLSTVNLPEPNHLKRIIVGGEPCPEKLVSQYAPRYTFYNKYGLTETTVTATIARLEPDTEQPVTIGRPLRNAEAYILGKGLELLPIGVVGELFIGGRGVAAGYLNNPDQSEARFIENPWGEGKIYKTGDLARWNANGTLQYLGRIDEQLQLRGYRVEPEEISSHLRTHPDIEDVAAVGWQEEQNLSLVAFYTSQESIEVAELREFLRNRLPVYMMPAHFIRIDKLPMTQNGKLDKAALRQTQATFTLPYEGPENEFEHALVQIWSEVLDLQSTELGVNQSFFELGGHSLRAIMALAKINRQFSVDFPLRMFFTIPTIRECAGVLQTMIASGEQVPVSDQEEEFIF